MRKIHLRATAILFIGVLVGFSVGCSNHPSDQTIAKDIQNRVAAASETKDSNVVVTAKNGEVTLTGTARSEAEQQRLEEIAREEPGTAAVHDQTSVHQEPPPLPIIVPAGTNLVVTIGQSLGSKTSQTGQTFIATLAQPVTVDNRTAIPKGSTVSGTVVAAKAKGKVKGEGQLSLALRSLTVGGQTYQIHTGVLDNTIKGKGKRTAATTGGAAAGGALIGGIAGGGKGAGIGALVGAAGGFVGGALTGNQQVELPAETALAFRLSAPLTLPPRAE